MDHTAEIQRFIASEFIPDIVPSQLDPDYDLLETGVVDSLQLVRVITWIGKRFDIPVEQVEFTPDHFRSVRAIQTFIDTTTTQVSN
ncbi:phosphopantetheine-binding protein [Streptomyces pathocidini]|uniref:Phosphopantetheine-binding protein n=1 Tax=Streptomyces pathocidini TaxID=1650571 RepID=A0ABW7UQR6_9ACTN|nr:phosphopantetheine-binding protein [Streptomyces pathocidini]